MTTRFSSADPGLSFKGFVMNVLGRVRYKDWGFLVTGDQDGDLMIQVDFLAPDNITGKPERQLGRRWLIEYNSTPTQIVQTAFLAVQRAEMHELAEQFTYKGATVFNRHLDVDELVKISERVG